MKNSIHLIVIGICGGIIVGLSVSPIVEKILALLITIVVSLVGLLCGISVEGSAITKKARITPAPLSIVMIGFLVGTLSGILMRTNNVLGASISDIKLSPRMKEMKDSLTIVNSITGLHASKDKFDCSELDGKHGADLKFELQKLGDDRINNSLKMADDSVSLEIIKTMLCSKQ